MAETRIKDTFRRMVGGLRGGQQEEQPVASAPVPQVEQSAASSSAMRPAQSNHNTVHGRKRPNILLLIADDMGAGDLSCLGSTRVYTPHIDRLAGAGCLCTSFYSASCICSPARAGLMSGLRPSHAGVRAPISTAENAVGLPGQVQLLSDYVHSDGYRTAFFGKWMLGGAAESRPEAHSYDESLYHLAERTDLYSHIHYGSNGEIRRDLYENGRITADYDGAFFTDILTNQALRFMRSSADIPFFITIAYPSALESICLPAEYKNRFPGMSGEARAFASAVSSIDDSIGKILDELLRLGKVQDTLILFTSDNGAVHSSIQPESTAMITGNFLGGKGSLFEGGIRVPGLFSWPAILPTGQWIPDCVSALDFVPTALSAAGIPIPPGLKGVNLLPRFCSEGTLPVRDLYWEYGNQTAMRSGRWKLTINGLLENGFPSEAALVLADMEADPHETRNLFSTYSGMGNEMTDRAMHWRNELEKEWLQAHGETGSTQVPLTQSSTVVQPNAPVQPNIAAQPNAGVQPTASRPAAYTAETAALPYSHVQFQRDTNLQPPSAQPAGLMPPESLYYPSSQPSVPAVGQEIYFPPNAVSARYAQPSLMQPLTNGSVPTDQGSSAHPLARESMGKP